MKEDFKTETHYSININVQGELESLDIIQEENVVGRNAIKVSLYQDRWRTVDDTIELLKKTIIAIEKNFKYYVQSKTQSKTTRKFNAENRRLIQLLRP